MSVEFPDPRAYGEDVPDGSFGGARAVHRPDCPHPEKRQYATEAGANLSAESTAATYGRRLRAYACRCGWWHLTHLGGALLPTREDGAA
ncbi:hypothetical protein [Streptomyces sp. DT18]